VNESARVSLVGITPGWHQMQVACRLGEAQAAGDLGPRDRVVVAHLLEHGALVHPLQELCVRGVAGHRQGLSALVRTFYTSPGPGPPDAPIGRARPGSQRTAIKLSQYSLALPLQV